MWEPSQLGILCEQTGDPGQAIINRMDNKVDEAGTALKNAHTLLGKTLILKQPFHYNGQRLTCELTVYPELYSAYWYHPDHLGSSSYITNLAGEITQHMEYLPFGETLVEEHLNSNNSPYKFNAKEYDAETGNYYYGARYYDPKWVIWLSVDAEFAKFPSYSPFNYTFLNPIKYIDPDGNSPNPIKQLIFSRSRGNTGGYTLKNFRFTPASNQSWHGSTTNGSIIKDGQNSIVKGINLLFEISNPEYARSASVSITENKGQYYDDKGSMVDNIADASKLVISEYTKTESINLYEGGILGKTMTVNESLSTQTFDVLEGGNLSYIDSSYDSATKIKDISNASGDLLRMVEEVSTGNRTDFKSQQAQMKAKLYEGQMENNLNDVKRESKQEAYGN